MTSKKCWVVNMRMKKPEKPGEERTSNGDDSNILRPLAPKGDENGVDLSVQSLYANQFASQFLPIDATTAQYIAQLNGTRPFLTYPGSYPGHMINPMIPGITGSPYGYALVPDKKEQLSKELDKNHEFPGPKSMKLSTVPVKEEQEADENQNTQTNPTTENGTCSELKEKTEPVKVEDEDEGHEDTLQEDSGTIEGETEVMENSEGDTASQPTNNLNMNAIKKVLQILDATVTKQQMQKDDKSSISKLASQSGEDKDGVDKKEDVSDSESMVNGDLLLCRFCKESFQSPVDHHQHERYLCKLNTDIQPKDTQSPIQHPNDQSNHSTEVIVNGNGTTSPSLSQTETEKGSEDETGTGHSDADTFMDKEGRQYRVRSMLTDEQQRILKAHYALNPRPNKFDLLQIASAVNFPKRVVQVWFQNMRARDRRRGNPVPAAPSSSILSSPGSCDKMTNGNSWPACGSMKNAPITTPYIPVVPQFPSNGVTPFSQSIVFNQYASPPPIKANGQIPTPQRGSPSPANLTFTMQVEPLDLSTKKANPTQAHSSKPFTPVTHTDQLEEGEVLNLSKRSKDAKPGESQPLETSAIYKYMQQEGMITNGGGSDGGNHSNRSTPNLHPPLVRPSSGAHTPLPMGYSRSTPEPRPSQTVFPVATSTPNHINPLLMRASPILPSVGSPILCTSPPSSLDSSFNSTVSLDSAGLENGLKVKRARKKSWRQVSGPVSTVSMALRFLPLSRLNTRSHTAFDLRVLVRSDHRRMEPMCPNSKSDPSKTFRKLYEAIPVREIPKH